MGERDQARRVADRPVGAGERLRALVRVSRLVGVGDRAGGARRARGGRGLDALPEQRAQVRRRVGDRRGDAAQVQPVDLARREGGLVVADRARLELDVQAEVRRRAGRGSRRRARAGRGGPRRACPGTRAGPRSSRSKPAAASAADAAGALNPYHSFPPHAASIVARRDVAGHGRACRERVVGERLAVQAPGRAPGARPACPGRTRSRTRDRRSRGRRAARRSARAGSRSGRGPTGPARRCRRRSPTGGRSSAGAGRPPSAG